LHRVARRVHGLVNAPQGVVGGGCGVAGVLRRAHDQIHVVVAGSRCAAAHSDAALGCAGLPPDVVVGVAGRHGVVAVQRTRQQAAGAVIGGLNGARILAPRSSLSPRLF